jgi:phenylpropionate dioxygenase-like ring-hydroxylating dioxygenase large terminal subunit
LGKNIIIVRGKDRQIRAFHNVCRHRGTNVAEGSGNCKYFTCRFHGWVYDTQGNIRDIPEAAQFYELDRSKLNLDPVHCELWKNFIFVNFDRKPRETLTEQLAEIGDKLAEFPFESMKVAGRWGATLKANWKLFLDAFQEGYHVATVHAGTIGNYFTGGRNPGCRPYHLELYKRNRAMSFSFNPDFEPHPSELFAVQVGESLSQGKAALAKKLPGTNPDDDPYYSFDINAIFPNWLLDTSIGFFFIHELPRGHRHERGLPGGNHVRLAARDQFCRYGGPLPPPVRGGQKNHCRRTLSGRPARLRVSCSCCSRRSPTPGAAPRSVP